MLKRQGCSPEKGDILISKDGEKCLNLIFVYSQNEEIVLLSSIAIVRLNEKNNPLFYRYYLLSPVGQSIMKKWFRSGTAIPRVVLKDFRNVPVPKVPFQEQVNIANILLYLDTKIANFQKQNQTLEKITQTLFKQWFVDFNFLDENGKPYKDNGGEMVGSELGEIPLGWRVKKLGRCLKALIDNRGKTPKFVESGIPALSAKFVKNGNVINRDKFNFVPHDLFNQSEKLLTDDIIMTSEAPLGELYYVSENTLYYPAQRVFAIRADRQVVLPSYLYFWLDSFVGQYLVKRRGSGSTVQGIKQSELKECEVIIPDRKLMDLADSSLKVILLTIPSPLSRSFFDMNTS